MAQNQCSACGRKTSYRDAECPWCGAPTTPSSSAESESRRGRTQKGPFGFLRRHWNGEYSLARSYWVNSLLVSLFAPGLGLLLLPLISDRPARVLAGAALLVTALGYVVWFWAVRGTWISATKHTIAGGKWGGIAKGMIVLGALASAGRVARDRGKFGEQVATFLGKQAGPRYTVRVADDGKSLTVTGGMNDGAAAALTRALDHAPGVRTVSFDSGGGWVREGRLLAGVISQRGLATNVDVECSSACTLAFLAGRERTLGPGALIGFHQVRLVGQSDDARALDVAQTEAMYRSAGLPTDFLDKVMATPPDQMWYPTPAELLTAKVITGRTSLNESRAEFARASVRARSEASAKGFPNSDGGLTAMLDCKVHQYVEWLSTTECSYRYDDPSKSLDEHLEDQKACLDRAGSAAKLRQIGTACATVTALFKP